MNVKSFPATPPGCGWPAPSRRRRESTITRSLRRVGVCTPSCAGKMPLNSDGIFLGQWRSSRLTRAGGVLGEQRMTCVRWVATVDSWRGSALGGTTGAQFAGRPRTLPANIFTTRQSDPPGNLPQYFHCPHTENFPTIVRVSRGSQKRGDAATSTAKIPRRRHQLQVGNTRGNHVRVAPDQALWIANPAPRCNRTAPTNACQRAANDRATAPDRILTHGIGCA